MADVTITITIPGPIYDALDTARKNNLVSSETVNQDGSKTITQRPKFASVEAQIQEEMTARFAPYQAEIAKADPSVTALETQIAGLRAQLLQKTTPTVAVTKQAKP